jgi:outer membrane immunogenic protein
MKTLALCGSILAVCIASASAADMAAKAPRYGAPAEAAATWTGFYLGASLGFKEADANWTTVSLANPLAPAGAFAIDGSSPAKYQPSAGRFGGFLGYDLQFAPQWIAGIELDAAYADGSKTIAGIPGCVITCILGVPGPAADVSSVKMQWDASARGRLGYLVSPGLLIYGTGGIAWQSIQGSATCQNNLNDAVCFNLAGSPSSTVTNNTIRTGWTVGGGIDARISGNWMLRGEYRYSDFGTWNNSYALGAGGAASATTVGTQLKISTQTGMVGIAYKFGGPIVARY